VTLRPAPRVMAAHLDGQAVLLDLASKDYFRLNETSALVWSGIERGETREQILAALVAGFEVGEAEAARALDALLAELRQRGLLAAE
jgi:hypothetical protein